MSGVTIIVVGAAFFGVLMLLAAVMAWQEVATGRAPAPPEYVVEDAIAAVWESLDEPIRGRLGTAGVRRIIEWEVFYLQGLADKRAARKGITVVAGGDDSAVAYVVRELARRGHSYSEEDVRAVLAGEAAYLHAIGAIGEAVGEEA